MPHGHEPVLATEVLDLLNPQPGELVVDCTLGRGGHSLLLRERVAPGGRLIAFERDPRNLEYARDRLGDAADLRYSNFSDLRHELGDDVGKVNALLADFGVSTNQLLTSDYGLSFADRDAPLDMRLDPELRDTAADLLRYWPEKKIADTIFEFAGERFSRRIARRIVEQRKAGQSVRTTGELADIVRRCVPRPPKHKKNAIDPATRTFMALRMAVNGELDAIEKLLEALPDVLAPGGRVAIISFHSGEDRLVKNAFREAAKWDRLEILTKKPIAPGEAEVESNPRSRSAKMRAARRP